MASTQPQSNIALREFCARFPGRSAQHLRALMSLVPTIGNISQRG